jgi:hypothetical protein
VSCEVSHLELRKKLVHFLSFALVFFTKLNTVIIVIVVGCFFVLFRYRYIYIADRGGGIL